MKTFKIVVLISIYLFQYFFLTTNDIYAQNQKEKLDVLFISSFDSGFISFDDQLKGIMNGFDNNVNLRIEYMDLKIFDTKDNEEKFYNLIKQSLEFYKIDAIIAGDDEATEFCIRYRDDLFKDIPISFLGVQDKVRIERALELDLMTGVTEVESIKANIELIKRFHPQVDTITFIDSYAIETYEEITSQYKELDFNWIVTNDIPLKEVKKMLSKLDKNDALIQLYVKNFKDNDTMSKEEINEIIAGNVKSIPIYNILSYDIGNGSIGGKVVDHFNQGQSAAKLVLELLNGKNGKDIYIEDDSANKYTFDYKHLRKFGVQENYLPENSKVLNSPNEIFKEYKGVIIVFIMLAIGLVGIVITLLWYIYYRIKYEKAIIEAMHNAEEANKTKSHFIANISHELKTPINVIMAAVQLNKIKNSKEPELSKNRNNLDIIDDNCSRLLRLINNIIDVQKVDLEQSTLKLTCINIVDSIENLVTSVVPYAKAKDLTVIFDTDEEEVYMDLDINKIERVILNLLSNAIKFSNKHGEIRINLKFDEFLEIIIEDDGIGIEKSKINNIFEKFTQIDNSLCRKNEGSGIGLSIVKSFVELHNGKVLVDSEINKGSRFTVRLPINRNEELDIDNYNEEKLKENIKIELSDIYM